MLLASYMAENGLTDGELGAALGVSAELVRLWRHGRRQISAKRAIDISKETGIPLHKLRPDLWDDPHGSATPAAPKSKAKRARSAGAAANTPSSSARAA